MSYKLIPARVSNENEDALCPTSPTNIHFFQLFYDGDGRLVPVRGRLTCEACGQPIKQKGFRWVLDRYVIVEADDIEDLV
jgi:hypothetical protein